MGVEINLVAPSWQLGKNGVHICGSAFPAGGLEVEQLSAWSEDRYSVDCLLQLNGFYAVVVEREGSVFAAVDRVRSIPLFYGQTGDDIWISDDFEWVRGKVGSREMDPVCREEFLRTGFVTGRETLFPGVFQLQAGECLSINLEIGTLKPETVRYYRFWHAEPETPFDGVQFEQNFRQVAETVHRRLVAYADGRQIVVPLSGGFDSRLIVTMLRKLGYENVLTFTYGIPGNAEAEISRRVAKSLGYEWRFVPYSDAMWRNFFFGEERRKYYRSAYGGASLPHPQDWPAIDQLRRDGLIDADCVVAPGHSGDFVAGSHIPKFIEPGYAVKPSDLFKSIVERHYNPRPKDETPSISKEDLRKRIESRLNFQIAKNEFDLSNLFEFWDWQERQAKYIINSVRVYDYFEYNWWLPLWDNDFVTFWEAAPLKIRINQRNYQTMVDRLYFDESKSIAGIGKVPEFEIGSMNNISVKDNVFDLIRKSIKKFRIADAIMKLYKYKSEKVMASNVFGNTYLISNFLNGYSANGLYAKMFISEIENFDC